MKTFGWGVRKKINPVEVIIKFEIKRIKDLTGFTIMQEDSQLLNIKIEKDYKLKMVINVDIKERIMIKWTKF